MVLEAASSTLCASQPTFLYHRRSYMLDSSANDMENDRFAYDSTLSQRALREIYLMPFMIAQKYSKPWAYMTASVSPVSYIRIPSRPNL